MYKDIYPKELKLNKANQTDTKCSFLDLDLTIENKSVISKIYDKREDFDFDIVNFPHLDGDVPKSTSYGVYISQLVRFSRCCSRIEDFNFRNKLLTAKLLKQGYRYKNLCRSFSKFYRKYSDLMSKYQCSLKYLIHEGICLPEFYGDFVYKVRNILQCTDFDSKFVQIINKFLKKGYNKDILRQSSCLVLNPFTLRKYSDLF